MSAGADGTKDECNDSRPSLYTRNGQLILDIMLIGDYDAGKSSIIRRFVEGTFENEYPTIGCSFLIKNVEIDGKDIHLRVWDTAGGERYTGPGPAEYRHCHGVIIVYDVTNKVGIRDPSDFHYIIVPEMYLWSKCSKDVPNVQVSFDNIQAHWLKRVDERGPNVLIRLLVGAKCDLPTREVEYSTAKAFADNVNIPLIETSSKTGINIDRAVMTAVAMVIKNVFDRSPVIREYEFHSNRNKDNSCNIS